MNDETNKSDYSSSFLLLRHSKVEPEQNAGLYRTIYSLSTQLNERRGEDRMEGT
jgi:hypothetical protein